MAIALIWCGLAALVYVPAASPGFESSMIAAGGFLAFTAGLLRFSGVQQAEMLEELQLRTKQETDNTQQ